MTHPIAIIGAGMAGLACARRLAYHGRAVRLFEKGRKAGGRLSTRRIETALGTVQFDHGAQYFTARDADFAAEPELAADRIAAVWPSRIRLAEAGLARSALWSPELMLKRYVALYRQCACPRS